MRITDHAYDRAKERLSLSRPAFERLATKAFQDGQTRFCGKLQRYADKLLITTKANRIRIYGEVVYVCAGEVLLTVYQLPFELRAYAKLRKK